MPQGQQQPRVCWDCDGSRAFDGAHRHGRQRLGGDMDMATEAQRRAQRRYDAKQIKKFEDDTCGEWEGTRP